MEYSPNNALRIVNREGSQHASGANCVGRVKVTLDTACRNEVMGPFMAAVQQPGDASKTDREMRRSDRHICADEAGDKWITPGLLCLIPD